jgi:RNA polymerase-binding transcription factor DksA
MTFETEPSPTRTAEDIEAAARAVLEASEQRLHAIEATLRSLTNGTYGRCEICGERVEDLAIAADPTAARCRAHADRVEVNYLS